MKIGIIGGGVAGLFTAYHLVRAGQEVVLFDSGKCGEGCSWDAAGMLAPINELEFQELELLQAGVASRAMYEGVDKELGGIGLLRHGTFEVALVPDDEGYLRRLYEFQKEQGLPVEWVPGPRIKELDHFLNRNLPCAIWSPADWQVDNHLLVKQLVRYILTKGGDVCENEAVVSWENVGEDRIEIRTNGGKEFPRGSDANGNQPEIRKTYQVDRLVVAAGLGQFSQNSLPYKIYPVRGEMISLKTPDFRFLEKTVRIRNSVLGNAYIVPKPGRILIGSTSEEKGMDASNTAGGILDILRKSYAAVPGIYELDVLDTWAGLRPSTLNRLPICDREGDSPVYHLNGLYRHGILLSPLLGKAMTELILHGRRLPEVENFRLGTH